MKIVLFSLTRSELKRLVAVLILGAILGAAGLNLVLGRIMDNLVYRKNQLAQELEVERQRIKKLEEAWESGHRGIVRELKIYLDFPEDKHTQQLLVRETGKVLGGLLGRELAEDDAFLVRDVLNRRIVNLEGKNYTLDFLFFIFVDGRLSIYLTAVELKNKEDPRD